MSEQDDHAEIQERALNDSYCGRVDVDLAEVGDGYAETTPTVAEDHLNFYGTSHRGAVYSLVDAALAAASNSRDDAAFALEMSISYPAAAEVGETLRAIAWETHPGRRIVEYEAVVSGEDGEQIATFRGCAYKPDGR